MGRAVSYPRFGIFTFTAPELVLDVLFLNNQRELLIQKKEINSIEFQFFWFLKNSSKEKI